MPFFRFFERPDQLKQYVRSAVGHHKEFYLKSASRLDLPATFVLLGSCKGIRVCLKDRALLPSFDPDLLKADPGKC
jgi:hypothetical protein